ncbi:MAG: radical SAM family heme chaperone HemW [Lacipirellulaceae bacterium]
MASRSAYLHVPFCRHRCGYCNFAVVAGRDDLAEDYLRAIATELSWLGEPRPVATLYFGGGTPTRLDPPQLARLLELGRQWFPPIDAARHAEWTVEANPGDLTGGAIELLAAHGVTRISLGVQSLDDAKLRHLERDHTASDVERVVDQAQQGGLAVSTDLIFAAPGETLADWRRDLAGAISLRPDHVSTYGLTYERGTAFWSRLRQGGLSEVDEELQRSMYLEGIDRLKDAGFEHYEVSNHARPGARSRHNESYWAGREYYAAGPGAARYLDGVRETNHRSTTTYLKRIGAGESPVAERERLDPEARARERLVFGLRRLEGVAEGPFAAATGFTIDALAGGTIAKHVSLGLLERADTTLRLTREGLLVSDAIWPDLL